ncbi:MAG: DUF3164 family protein [Muribaculaceae bacterium]|nr:DUF3164 family protein [Muribaculaceae bacterium]
MEEKVKQTVEMSAEEMAAFEAFKEAQAKAAAEEQAKKEREDYKDLVDDEIERSIPILMGVSERIKESKQQVLENFRSIIDLKGELFKTKVKDGQRSHTFTNSEGNKRIILGYHVSDDYRDTVENGIDMVKDYIAGLANDEKTQALVNMVFRLLARDAKGTLKASRIVQLRKIADEIGAEQMLQGVKIIEEAYQPAVSKQYIRAEVKDDAGQWKSIPLGMTES